MTGYSKYVPQYPPGQVRSLICYLVAQGEKLEKHNYTLFMSLGFHNAVILIEMTERVSHLKRQIEAGWLGNTHTP